MMGRTDSMGRRRAYYDSSDSGDLTRQIEINQRQSLKEAQSFLRSSDGQCEHDDEHDSWFVNFILSQRFEAFGGCVVLVNLIIITLETHARAGGDKAMLGHVSHANRILLAYYVFECFSRLFVLRRHFFFGAWNLLDLVIVVTGLVSEVLETIAISGAGFEQIGMLKSLRMMRLIRLVRLLVAFRELYVLLAGLGRCMKTLLWASGLIFLVLNVWAIVSVEWLDRVVQDLAAEGAFGNCGWCGDAFADIWKANLTWFQVVSGDGWAALGRPLAERAPWTYLFFVTNICVMVWGLLNLVVAAIVDASIQAREDDVQGAARNAVRAKNNALDCFRSLCREMDQNDDGEVTTEEFKVFKQSSTQLQQHLQIMGITDCDFEKCLSLMDIDGNGRLDFDELASEFTKMTNLVVKTNLYYILRHVELLHQSIIDLRENHHDTMSDISSLRADIQEMKALISVGTHSWVQNPSFEPKIVGAESYIAQSGLGADASLAQGAATGADPCIMRLPVSSIAQGFVNPNLAMPKFPSEASSGGQVLFTSPSARHEQLLKEWSNLNCSTGTSFNHCKELCKNTASTEVGVVKPIEPEEMQGMQCITSSGLAAHSSELVPLSAPILQPERLSAPVPSRAPPSPLGDLSI